VDESAEEVVALDRVRGWLVGLVAACGRAESECSVRVGFANSSGDGGGRVGLARFGDLLESVVEGGSLAVVVRVF
jgi:hypothetical protein